MSKGKIIFCLFLFLLSVIYIKDKLEEINLFELLINKNKTKIVIKNTLNKKLNLNENKIVYSKKNEIITKKPLIYFYNTHQTEEYASNVYNITPTVVTVSNMLKEQLKDKNIPSIVENKSVAKDLKKSGEDYTYTYTITFNYLKKRKKENPTLKYYFDIHRDSVKGEASKATIRGKKYAKVMFLIGKTNPNYKKNVNNINIMMKYIKKNYPGLVKDIYYQKICSFYQAYSPNMFLVEIGGVDSTLEELYNTSEVLTNAIVNYIEEGNYEE